MQAADAAVAKAIKLAEKALPGAPAVKEAVAAAQEAAQRASLLEAQRAANLRYSAARQALSPYHELAPEVDVNVRRCVAGLVSRVERRWASFSLWQHVSAATT